MRTTNYDALAASHPLNTTAAVVRDGLGESWDPEVTDGRIHSAIPLPLIRCEPGARDLTGLVVDRLTVMGLYCRKPKGARYWSCRCVCGAFEARKERKLLEKRDLPKHDPLECFKCDKLHYAQKSQKAAVSGRWPDGSPANLPGLNTASGSKTLKDMGITR